MPSSTRWPTQIADYVFEGVPMAQAIPIYPFPNGFVPASGVRNSLDNGAPAAEPLEDDGAASTPKTATDLLANPLFVGPTLHP
eukprot:CAMPEP_0181199940 /NCGR_PEP_ID=MMETSP1096-20121128/17468_1 /TAXON_ID=156174 ORGANISM="Chrysochromulina ericina, Strain CCMP281" /NCGR_SAMPLE_ID=MMETSP1096 /ASSEMBLY_ACC=CAM_ASM_000453 /LENGTH=82 /DNA_ID=CAMNT_0023290203 /DNA_START=685 /DNA_END=933 /DNA_ORIENTATION=+